ncbi:ABC-type nitrate/sulfonate/bicarbonate transport system, periplasmic component [Clostridium pasteurianum DSM 525 = ATCC 6013]|uniref:ABC-type nitrate/sulfonate/bicarbonate transport system, periplasmic component n=1 Tax=Clostridium pasteurianum DSM 525 = ATCC 6013 TaxID=1262449 RepID=A0A0H3JBB6_CLOPA|nr:ABC transporter substrate-binding protein [Clostridium pasteurianum]AJA49445.1 ABC-type nitrate/sulfonate/bicarbonate transport system, periplasmic component [Clostridium pasteurianum DSM 525 = ATCC 6013]AJA53433.1 ABC-type nitrate/sulfonate/bicarbonate transport system, periplasmic component [Clostridium pasteurianum DSM 525 = ATCC 6013]AOZ76612.1 nitrate ABC transporter substrate-binding protein [Clostridium pasteurianum DSM 525 = ATCC 6013]AOZ80409.1 nitrate ABC transporter substrate-bind
MFKKRSNKKFFLLIISLVCLISLVATACGKQSSSASTSSSTAKEDKLKPDSDGLIPIRTSSKIACDSTPWVVADKKGFFKKYGLKVVYTGETQAAQRIPALLNGNNYVESFHPNTYAPAIAGGANIIGIGPAGIDPAPDIDPKYRHMWWFVSAKASEAGVKSFKDLANYKKGQKLKFTTGSANICTDFEGNTLADKFGIPRDRIEWVTMPDVQALQALTQGTVDVSAVHPPFYIGMEKAGNVKIADTQDTGLGATAGLTYWVVNKTWAAENPNVARKFLKAITEANTWSNHNTKEAATLTAEHIKQPVSGSHYYTETLNIDNEKYLKPWLEDSVKNGSIPAGKVKVSDMVTDEYYK